VGIYYANIFCVGCGNNRALPYNWVSGPPNPIVFFGAVGTVFREVKRTLLETM